MSAGIFGRVCAVINVTLADGETFDSQTICDLLPGDDRQQVCTVLNGLATGREELSGSSGGYTDPPLELASVSIVDGRKVRTYRVRRHHVPDGYRQVDASATEPRRPACPTCHMELTTSGVCGWC